MTHFLDHTKNGFHSFMLHFLYIVQHQEIIYRGSFTFHVSSLQNKNILKKHYIFIILNKMMYTFSKHKFVIFALWPYLNKK